MGYFIVGLIVFLGISVSLGLIGGIIYLIYWPIKRRLIKSGKLTPATSKKINVAFLIVLLLFAIAETYLEFPYNFTVAFNTI